MVGETAAMFTSSMSHVQIALALSPLWWSCSCPCQQASSWVSVCCKDNRPVPRHVKFEPHKQERLMIIKNRRQLSAHSKYAFPVLLVPTRLHQLVALVAVWKLAAGTSLDRQGEPVGAGNKPYALPFRMCSSTAEQVNLWRKEGACCKQCLCWRKAKLKNRVHGNVVMPAQHMPQLIYPLLTCHMRGYDSLCQRL